jgi:hypothetical protein
MEDGRGGKTHFGYCLKRPIGVNWKSSQPFSNEEEQVGFHKEAKRMEDQWFQENDARLLKKLRTDREARVREHKAREAKKKQDELREMHWMCCPKCGHEMKSEDLCGVEVDICSMCEGIYLDRGELEDLFLKQQAEQRRGFLRRLLGLGEN